MCLTKSIFSILILVGFEMWLLYNMNSAVPSQGWVNFVLLSVRPFICVCFMTSVPPLKDKLSMYIITGLQLTSV